MGNYRFKLADMMPNAWFYKLKDMGKTRNHSNSNSNNNNISNINNINNITSNHHYPVKKKHSSPIPFNPHRQSYYFSPDPYNNSEKLYNSPINPKLPDLPFPDPPKKSPHNPKRSPKSSRRKTINSPKLVAASSVSAGWAKSGSTPEYSTSPFDSSPEKQTNVGNVFDGVISTWSSSTDIIIDVDSKKFAFDRISKRELPPIMTKPAKFTDMVSNLRKKESELAKFRKCSAKTDERNRANKDLASSGHQMPYCINAAVKEQKGRRSSVGSAGGVKLRAKANSPRIASKKIQAYGRKSVSSSNLSSKTRRKNISDSFAIVKSSVDPQRDFRESMLEMIVENNIRASKDLEELLACYLSLNSSEYHDLIVKVFEQIWFDLTDNQL
ncbi:hypothetical protein GIB67_041159 [Kingdonia uniflora]|uniref:Transcription repressor n=1 Tax=Kingdonia uniflora TaxID=39325 RepID=A0A7J7LK95_9MAGN|nr:hypothetical protein GIB67_041159 [Kingdonia uniflora]